MTSNHSKEFVVGWDVLQTLGEGAYGEVKLLVNRSTGEAVAMKMINISRHPEAVDAVKKEICAHRILQDPHIIRFFGHRCDDYMQYIFLEYAVGGELFDRIEPDAGMPVAEAQKYFKQLLLGVEYLHSHGVTHRDLKPENLLLNEHDSLKISDFGMATVFRYQGKERTLDKRCGTVPYMAPEVMVKPYRAEPADIWSCGVILVALLTGELPWDEPGVRCHEFRAWKDKKITHSPWTKIENLSLSLLRNVLQPLPSRRYTINQIKQNVWFNKKLTHTNGPNSVWSADELALSPKKRCSEQRNAPISPADTTRLAYSQPDPGLRLEVADKYHGVVRGQVYSFSQPTQPEDMFLNTQFQNTQPSSSQTPLQRLVKRMTRFFVRTGLEVTMQKLDTLFEKMGYSLKINSPGQITVTTLDRRKMPLIFKTNLIEMGSELLVDFRLSKGCGLEFKRHFIKLKEKLADCIVQSHGL